MVALLRIVGALSTHIHGTEVPVEQSSTASRTTVCNAKNERFCWRTTDNHEVRHRASICDATFLPHAAIMTPHASSGYVLARQTNVALFYCTVPSRVLRTANSVVVP